MICPWNLHWHWQTYKLLRCCVETNTVFAAPEMTCRHYYQSYGIAVGDSDEYILWFFLAFFGHFVFLSWVFCVSFILSFTFAFFRILCVVLSCFHWSIQAEDTIVASDHWSMIFDNVSVIIPQNFNSSCPHVMAVAQFLMSTMVDQR